MDNVESKPPLEVDEATLERWKREAREAAQKTIEEFRKKYGDNWREIIKGQGVPGIPGVQGWCKQCDRSEEHKHTFTI